MNILISALSGLVFGFGLILSGMANPAKVLGFLDLAGDWDPSLIFVMGGAIGVGLLAFGLARRRSHTFTGAPLSLPASRTIDRPLVFGALLFGVGWGIAGICPGPALVGVAMLHPKVILFAVSMLAGMVLFAAWRRFGRR